MASSCEEKEGGRGDNTLGSIPVISVLRSSRDGRKKREGEEKEKEESRSGASKESGGERKRGKKRGKGGVCVLTICNLA